MIDKTYFYFLRSKYTNESTREDLVKLKDLFAKSFQVGISIKSLSEIKRGAIEVGVIGRELTEYERKVDNFILQTPSIVRGFFQRSFEEEEETLEEVSASIERIRQSILNNMSFSQREAYLLGEY